MRLRNVALASCALALFGARAVAQGRFSNFETPQTHPIEIATVNGADYVLVCNTPDNSVDIYDAAPPHAFKQRVPVGMGPATVRWRADLERFFTCNFDGDSVSVVRLLPEGSSVIARLERTSTLFVGDEPSDITFSPDNALAVVSLSSRSAITMVTPLALGWAGGESRLTLTGPLPNLPLAVKMPRAIQWLSDGRFFAANFRGGSPNPSATIPQYDVGIYRFDSAVTGGPDFIGGLGSTNHAFAVTASAQRMFVVGTKAQNHAAVGVQAVQKLATGFVQSWLMVLDIPPGGAMNVHQEAPIGTSAPPFPSINLNRNYSSSTPADVGTDNALVQPTDIQLIETAQGVSNIVISAFHSDRVAILTPSATIPGGYAIQRINIPITTPSSGYTVVGPRGVAYSATNQRIFTNGRLDNSLTAIDSTTGAITAHIQLPNDPTPAEIRAGRQFLYSNRFSIDDSLLPIKTGGFVACASCHVDGRTDGIPWDLGKIPLGPLIPADFHDNDTFDTTSMPNFPSEKGPLVTQTLQGLINYPLNDPFQGASTNAPYHWRGDKFDFTDFNEAFVNLQGMHNVNTAADPKGISDDQMISYRSFINTILHPPNFEQDVTRTTPGTLGTNPNDPLQASGGKLGMMLFHDFVMDDFGGIGRSCVDCHALPDGSSNTATDAFQVPKTVMGSGSQIHPFESAALRNLRARELLLHDDFTDTPAQYQATANNGLLHSGDPNFFSAFSINKFIHSTFMTRMPDQSVAATEVAALTQFVRQLDTGVAPLAGSAYTVDPTLSPLDSGLNQIAFDLLEGQVNEANIGLGVYTRHSGIVKGYWFDITQSPAVYREEGTANTLTRASLLALAVGTNNVVIAQGTPLGTERRWANVNGIGTQISDLANPPASIALENMAPNTAFVDIPKFNLNLHTSPSLPPPTSSIWSLRKLQESVVSAGTFGVTAVRHEPPRRFRVTGDHIRPGAKLLFAMASGMNAAQLPVQIMEMHLYPTQYQSHDRQIWETYVELDATHTFALLNGGYWAPDVYNVIKRLTSTPSLQPSTWNQFLVGVQNEDTSTGGSATNWQVLRVQDTR